MTDVFLLHVPSIPLAILDRFRVQWFDLLYQLFKPETHDGPYRVPLFSLNSHVVERPSNDTRQDRTY